MTTTAGLEEQNTDCETTSGSEECSGLLDRFTGFVEPADRDAIVGKRYGQDIRSDTLIKDIKIVDDQGQIVLRDVLEREIFGGSTQLKDQDNEAESLHWRKQPTEMLSFTFNFANHEDHLRFTMVISRSNPGLFLVDSVISVVRHGEPGALRYLIFILNAIILFLLYSNIRDDREDR